MKRILSLVLALVVLVGPVLAGQAWAAGTTVYGASGSAGAGSGDVIGPATNTDGYVPQWDGDNSKTLKGGVLLDTDGSLAGNSDSRIPSQKAVKAYADTKAAGTHNHAGADITSGTIDGDRLPAMSETKQGSVPATGTPSGKYLTDGGTWATPAGTGDVVGPSGATDNAITRYDTATGKLLQDSLATVDDSGTVNIPTGQTYNINGSPHTHNYGDASGPGSSTDNAIARFDGETGKLLQNGLATVDDNGAVNIPTGQTYNINGSPHTHDYQASDADLTAIAALSCSQGYYLKKGAANWECSSAGAVESGTATGGLIFGDSTPDTEGEIGYGSDVVTYYGSASRTLATLEKTQTFTGAQTIGDGSADQVVHLDATPASGNTGNGIYITVTSAAALNIGDVVYINSSSKAAKIDADQASTMPGICIMVESASAAGETKKCLTHGPFKFSSSPSYTVGGIVYGSTTAGATTTTAPSGTGDQVQVLGVALAADTIYFNPSYVLVEVK